MPGTPITMNQYENLKLPQHYRTALQNGEECWENIEIVHLLNNKKIFTQYFELKNDFMDSIEDIDVFYGFLKHRQNLKYLGIFYVKWYTTKECRSYLSKRGMGNRV